MKINKVKWTQTLMTCFLFVTACTSTKDPEPVEHDAKSSTKASTPPCVISLLGDKDGFGMNWTDGSTLSPAAGTSLPLDFRKPGDPRFSDLYPADMEDGQTKTNRIEYTHQFTLPSGAIRHAVIHLNTLGIQDGDSQVYGCSMDIKLFLDNEEVPNAFDTVDQFDYVNGKWSDIAGHIDVEIPSELLHVMLDGTVVVRWELYQLVPGCQSMDAFAIDYSELEVCGEDNR